MSESYVICANTFGCGGCSDSGGNSGSSGTTVGTRLSTIRILDVVRPSKENREELEASLDKFSLVRWKRQGDRVGLPAEGVIYPDSDEKRGEQSARVWVQPR